MVQILVLASIIVVLVMSLVLASLSLKHQKLLKEYFDLKERLKKETTEKRVLEKARRSLELGVERLVEREMAVTGETLSQVSKEIKMNTAKTLQNELKKRFDEEFAKALAEIEVYKKTKLVEVDKSINKIIETTTRQVLGEAIDTQKHEELVLNALASAKKENVF